MTKNIINAALVLLGGGALLTGCNFEQPDAPCFVQDSTAWYAKYDRVDEGSCPAADLAPVGERIGVFKYSDPDDIENKTLLTIRPNGVAALAASDDSTERSQTAQSRFTARPDENDFCLANAFNPAEVVVAGNPGTSIRYEFSNVRVYASPKAPGTQLTGELRYTKNGCTSTYVVRALWPAVGCTVGSTEAATACGNGSGLNPDFDAECMAFPTGTAPNCGATPAMLTEGYNGCCVPKKAIPSFIEG